MNSVSKWVQNVNSTLRRTSSTSSNSGNNASYNRSWIHSPDDLLEGVVKYTVKFMGDVAVDRPKGTDMIKDSIRRLKFQQDQKRCEGIVDMPKIELHISVKGVKMVDAKSHLIRHTLPLHKISFCADDKHDKRLFAFIAKISAPTDGASTKNACQSDGQHRCFVFLSDRLAEQITLTIGEAFDLAYRQFLDANNDGQSMTNGANSTISRSTVNRDGSSSQMKKLVDLLRKRIQELERENADLKQQLAQFQRSMAKNSVSVDDGAYLKPKWESFDSLSSPITNGTPVLNEDSTLPPVPSSPIPIPPPPQDLPRITHSLPRKKIHENDASKISNLDLMKDLSTTPTQQKFTNKINELVFDHDFNPRADEIPAEFSKLEISKKNELEMMNEQLTREIERNEALLAEMREGYKRGLTFGHEDFTSNGEAGFTLDEQQKQCSSTDDPFK